MKILNLGQKNCLYKNTTDITKLIQQKLLFLILLLSGCRFRFISLWNTHLTFRSKIGCAISDVPPWNFVYLSLSLLIHVIFLIRRVFVCMELLSKLELICIYISYDWFCRLIFVLIYRGNTIEQFGIVIIIERLVYWL